MEVIDLDFGLALTLQWLGFFFTIGALHFSAFRADPSDGRVLIQLVPSRVIF